MLNSQNKQNKPADFDISHFFLSHSNRVSQVEWLSPSIIVSQPSKCLKFMTFRKGCFVIHVECKYFSDFLSPSVVQKMKKDNIGQSGDYDPKFCEQQNTHGLFKFKSFHQFNPLNCLKF